MKTRNVRVVGYIFMILGFVLLLNSFSGVTGLVISDEIKEDTGYFIGAVFVVIGLLLAAARSSEERRYSAARKKLVDLLDGKEVKPEAAFNLLTRYDLVRYQGEKKVIRGKKYPVYIGHVKKEYGGGVEHFTVDRAEQFEMYLPHGIRTRMPSHVDVQRGGSYHKRVNIPWREFLHKNEDVLVEHGTNTEEVLKGLEHRDKHKRRAA